MTLKGIILKAEKRDIVFKQKTGCIGYNVHRKLNESYVTD